MPVYEYECEQCGVRFERLQRMSDAALTDCPECGGHIHRVMQPVGVIFKGSGFYVTDNRGRSSTGVPAQKKKDDESKTSASSSESASSSTSAKPDSGASSNGDKSSKKSSEAS